MASQLCNFSLPNHIPYSQNQIDKPKSSFTLSLPKASTLIYNKHTPQKLLYEEEREKQNVALSVNSSKRSFSLSILSVIINGCLSNLCNVNNVLAMEELELQRYTDSKEGFTLLRPSSYAKVDKAGATVLFEEVNKGSNNIGVVVNPVRLNQLGEFGTPQFVADKLIQAEKRKESTKDAEVIGVTERSGSGGLQVYEFEYKVDSTRGGLKRIFSAAFVASKKLYLLNIAHSDKPESPLDSQTRVMLEEVLHSFDAAPMT